MDLLVRVGKPKPPRSAVAITPLGIFDAGPRARNGPPSSVQVIRLDIWIRRSSKEREFAPPETVGRLASDHQPRFAAVGHERRPGGRGEAARGHGRRTRGAGRGPAPVD